MAAGVDSCSWSSSGVLCVHTDPAAAEAKGGDAPDRTSPPAVDPASSAQNRIALRFRELQLELHAGSGRDDRFARPAEALGLAFGPGRSPVSTTTGPPRRTSCTSSVRGCAGRNGPNAMEPLDVSARRCRLTRRPDWMARENAIQAVPDRRIRRSCSGSIPAGPPISLEGRSTWRDPARHPRQTQLCP